MKKLFLLTVVCFFAFLTSCGKESNKQNGQIEGMKYFTEDSSNFTEQAEGFESSELYPASSEEDTVIEDETVNSQEMLEMLEQTNSSLFQEAYQELIESDVELNINEDAVVKEPIPDSTLTQDSKYWGLGWSDWKCKKHYWNPAYWAARMIADVGYDYKNSFGFKSPEMCKAVLAASTTAECVIAVNFTLGWAGVTYIAGKYVWLTCAVASASACSCACDQEW